MDWEEEDAETKVEHGKKVKEKINVPKQYSKTKYAYPRAFLMKLYIRKWKNKAKKSAAEGGAHKMRRLSSAASKHAKELENFATEGEDIKEVG